MVNLMVNFIQTQGGAKAVQRIVSNIHNLCPARALLRLTVKFKPLGYIKNKNKQ